MARAASLKAALAALDREEGPAAERLRLDCKALLDAASSGEDPRDVRGVMLRRKTLPHARRALDALRDGGRIGDDAYRKVEQELDWLEMTTRL